MNFFKDEHGYIDPGSASIAFQFLLAFVLGGLAYVGIVYRKSIGRIKKLLNRKKSE